MRALQQELNKWRAEQWPKQAPIAENGRYTAETKKAVEEFQRANGLQTGSSTKLELTPNGIADTRVISGNEVIVAKKVAVYQRPHAALFMMASGLRSVRDKAVTYFDEAMEDEERTPPTRLFHVANLMAA